MNRKESKRRQNVTHVVLLFVTVVIYRTHLYTTKNFLNIKKIGLKSSLRFQPSERLHTFFAKDICNLC